MTDDEDFILHFAEDSAHHVALVDARNRVVLKERAQSQQLEMLHLGFEGPPENPLYAWAAIDYCGSNEIPLPHWIQQYLFMSARNVMGIIDQQEASNKDIPPALGFPAKRGVESVFAALRRDSLRERAVAAFARAILAGKDKEDAISDAIMVDNRVGGEAMENWLHDFFPGRRKGETWKDFLSDAVDVLSRSYQPWLPIVLRREG